MPVATKFGRVRIRASFHITHTTIWSRGLARSCEMLNLLYLYYNNAYGHQTWQGGDLLREASTIKVTQPFEQMVTWDHVIK